MRILALRLISAALAVGLALSAIPAHLMCPECLKAENGSGCPLCGSAKPDENRPACCAHKATHAAKNPSCNCTIRAADDGVLKVSPSIPAAGFELPAVLPPEAVVLIAPSRLQDPAVIGSDSGPPGTSPVTAGSPRAPPAHAI